MQSGIDMGKLLMEKKKRDSKQKRKQQKEKKRAEKEAKKVRRTNERQKSPKFTKNKFKMLLFFSFCRQ